MFCVVKERKQVVRLHPLKTGFSLGHNKLMLAPVALYLYPPLIIGSQHFTVTLPLL